jgi:CheY-like chemotaxis protein
VVAATLRCLGVIFRSGLSSNEANPLMTTSPAHPSNHGKTREIPAPKHDPSSLSVLLVEDDEKFAATVRLFLEGHGFEVEEVRDGKEAIRTVLDRDFDVILCDMIMPSFPGDKFYLAVERIKPQLCRRFIFMTGHRGEPAITEFVGKVGGFILWKPFEFRVMMDAISTLLGKRPTPRR